MLIMTGNWRHPLLFAQVAVVACWVGAGATLEISMISQTLFDTLNPLLIDFSLNADLSAPSLMLE